MKEFGHLRIGLDIIKHATNNFGDDHFIVESGSAGKVYRGEFKHSKGQVMCAVKRLDCTMADTDLLFWREIMLLTSYKHQNIVSLRGFCDESKEKIIVYDYACNTQSFESQERKENPNFKGDSASPRKNSASPSGIRVEE